MPQPFLEVFPREIRDQIYTFILASPSGLVTLSPWTVEVARSLSILRTCKQIHRECKDIIWYHKGLKLRESTQLFHKLKALSKNKHVRRIRQLKLCLELLDRDELEWMAYSLPALLEWCRDGRLESVTLSATWEKPSSVLEFKEILALRKEGEPLDGRLYLQEPSTWTRMLVNTGWPRFSHWGKQRWLREMLLDPSGIDQLLEKIHGIFGGQLYVDGVLCFNDWQRWAHPITLDPRNGEVKIVPGPKSYASPKHIRNTINS
jgi:hypothetical protein